MESEKLLIVGLVGVIIVVGLIVVASPYLFLTPANGNNDNNGGSSGTIPRDSDLLDLSLEVPDWNLVMSDDSIITMYELHGKFVIIDLMATWCTYCASQNSALLEIYNAIDSDSLVIISLTVDDTETIGMMAEYKVDNGLPWAHGLDTSDVFGDYFSVTSIPTAILIDADGYFRWVHSGVWTESSITQTLSQMMP
ncbi:MAG: redoxin domain-containing protein [Candidatus Thorarchaeota archaeon]|nr:redoxin domain-containing protein [Candidatus Thorarchaeota archaeon]